MNKIVLHTVDTHLMTMAMFIALYHNSMVACKIKCIFIKNNSM